MKKFRFPAILYPLFSILVLAVGGCEFSGASVSATTTDPKTGAIFSGTVTVPSQPRPSPTPVSPDRFVRDNK